MWPLRMWAVRYFPQRYWGKVGATSVAGPLRLRTMMGVGL